MKAFCCQRQPNGIKSIGCVSIGFTAVVVRILILPIFLGTASRHNSHQYFINALSMSKVAPYQIHEQTILNWETAYRGAEHTGTSLTLKARRLKTKRPTKHNIPNIFLTGRKLFKNGTSSEATRPDALSTVWTRWRLGFDTGPHFRIA